MVRAAKKHDKGVKAGAESNPEAKERKRLKKLALSKNIISETPPSRSNYSQLSPSKTVMKYHGKDILKKSQRKNRFLFSFPGLLAPITGGKIGELKDLGSKNPILYLEFPQGQMKLFGTIVYPKNRYLTLQFSRGGKNVMCEDYFDTMIVFCDAWWIGKKDENPDEARLEFPKELNEGQPVEYDFKGGAGATSENKQGAPKAGLTYVEEQSPITDSEDDLSNGENKIDLMKATPVRHSERTAGKIFNFAEIPSGGSSVDSDADISEGETKVDAELGKKENFCSVVLDIDNEDAAVRTHLTGKVPDSTTSAAKSNKVSQSANQVTRPEDILGRNHGSLVQATISTLFKKAEEKKAPTDSRKPQSPKVSGHELQHGDSKRKIDQADSPRKRGTKITAKKKRSEDSSSIERVKVYKRKTKSQAASAASVSLDDPASPVPNSSQVEDDIEDFSSTSQDTVESDEDWAA